MPAVRVACQIGAKHGCYGAWSCVTTWTSPATRWAPTTLLSRAAAASRGAASREVLNLLKNYLVHHVELELADGLDEAELVVVRYYKIVDWERLVPLVV